MSLTLARPVSCRLPGHFKRRIGTGSWIVSPGCVFCLVFWFRKWSCELQWKLSVQSIRDLGPCERFAQTCLCGMAVGYIIRTCCPTSYPVHRLHDRYGVVCSFDIFRLPSCLKNRIQLCCRPFMYWVSRSDREIFSFVFVIMFEGEAIKRANYASVGLMCSHGDNE